MQPPKWFIPCWRVHQQPRNLEYTCRESASVDWEMFRTTKTKYDKDYIDLWSHKSRTRFQLQRMLATPPYVQPATSWEAGRMPKWGGAESLQFQNDCVLRLLRFWNTFFSLQNPQKTLDFLLLESTQLLVFASKSIKKPHSFASWAFLAISHLGAKKGTQSRFQRKSAGLSASAIWLGTSEGIPKQHGFQSTVEKENPQLFPIRPQPKNKTSHDFCAFGENEPQNLQKWLPWLCLGLWDSPFPFRSLGLPFSFSTSGLSFLKKTSLKSSKVTSVGKWGELYCGSSQGSHKGLTRSSQGSHKGAGPQGAHKGSAREPQGKMKRIVLWPQGAHIDFVAVFTSLYCGSSQGAHKGPTRRSQQEPLVKWSSQGAHKGPTRGSQETHKGPTRGSQGSHKGLTTSSQGSHKGLTRGPQGAHKGSTREPQGKIKRIVLWELARKRQGAHKDCRGCV